MGTMGTLFKSDRKITALLIVVTFVLSNIVTIVPESDIRRVKIEVDFQYALAKKSNYPEILRPYKGSSKKLTRSEMEEISKKDNVKVLSSHITLAEADVNYDKIRNPNTQRNAVQVANLSPATKVRYVDNISSRHNYISRRPRINTGEEGPGGNNNTQAPQENKQVGNNDPVDLELTPADRQEAEEDKKDFIDEFGKKKRAAREGKKQAKEGIKEAEEIKRHNRVVRRRWENDPRRASYEPRNFKKLDKEDPEKNEQDAVEELVGDVKMGTDDITKEAQDMQDKSNKEASEGQNLMMLAIILMTIGAMLLRNPATASMGIALIVAGIALLMMGQKKKEKAQELSDRADAMYDQGLNTVLTSNDYINQRLGERDTAVSQIRQTNYKTEPTPSVYGRGDVRSKQKFYRNTHGMGTVRSRSIRNSMRERGTGNTIRSR